MTFVILYYIIYYNKIMHATCNYSRISLILILSVSSVYWDIIDNIKFANRKKRLKQQIPSR